MNPFCEKKIVLNGAIEKLQKLLLKKFLLERRDIVCRRLGVKTLKCMTSKTVSKFGICTLRPKKSPTQFPNSSRLPRYNELCQIS